MTTELPVFYTDSGTQFMHWGRVRHIYFLCINPSLILVIYKFSESVGPATGSVLTENFGFKFTCTVMAITYFLTVSVSFVF